MAAEGLHPGHRKRLRQRTPRAARQASRRGRGCGREESAANKAPRRSSFPGKARAPEPVAKERAEPAPCGSCTTSLRARRSSWRSARLSTSGRKSWPRQREAWMRARQLAQVEAELSRGSGRARGARGPAPSSSCRSARAGSSSASSHGNSWSKSLRRTVARSRSNVGRRSAELLAEREEIQAGDRTRLERKRAAERGPREHREGARRARELREGARRARGRDSTSARRSSRARPRGNPRPRPLDAGGGAGPASQEEIERLARDVTRGRDLDELAAKLEERNES